MKLRPISFQWSNLLICSWAVEPNAIMPLLTPGLIPHCWYGSAYVSLVGLTVSDHRCAGVVLHPRNFRQVNIRSYPRACASWTLHKRADPTSQERPTIHPDPMPFYPYSIPSPRCFAARPG